MLIQGGKAKILSVKHNKVNKNLCTSGTCAYKFLFSHKISCDTSLFSKSAHTPCA